MAFKNIIQAVTLTSIDSSTLNGSYQVINATGLPQGCVFVYITNASNKDVTVSYDGINDNEYVRASETKNLLFQMNALPNAHVATFAKGTKIYVKGTAGTGNIYVSGYYQPIQN